MAGIKISDLPAAPSAQLTDVFPVDQLPGPVTYKESNSQLLALFQANGAAGSNGNVQYNNNGAFGGDSGFNTDGAGNIKISGTLAVGSSSIPNSTVEIRNTLSGSTTDVLRLTNATSSGVNSGVSLTFQPNNKSVRAASIRSVQTTAGNFADLEFYTAGGGTPALGMKITTSQQVLVGTPTVVGSSQFQTSGEGTGGAILLGTFVNSTTGSQLRIAKSRSAVAGVSVTVQNGDSLGLVSFFGDDGNSASNFPEGARIQSNVTGSVSTGIVPSNLMFSTADTSGTLTTAMVISNAQIVTLTNPLPVGSGGLGIATTPTNGQVPIGNGTTYTAANLTAGAGISITNGAGSITIASTTSGMTWTTVSGTSQSAAVNNGYITNNAGAVTITLPTTFAVGDEVEVKGLGAGGWVLAAGTATTIRLGSSVTSSAGSLTSANQYDTVKVTGLVANTTWSVDYALSTGLTVA